MRESITALIERNDDASGALASLLARAGEAGEVRPVTVTRTPAPLTRSRRTDVNGEPVHVYYAGSDPTIGPRVYTFADDTDAGTVYCADTDKPLARYTSPAGMVPAIRTALALAPASL